MDTLVPGRISGRFIAPVLFVDGHSRFHDFTRAISDDPEYPYEPTKDWIWYKPAASTNPPSVF
jgi:prepilin-type processing-associated H-X9-DG protein